MIALNQVLRGKYRVTGRLSGGGMSTVYTAEDLQLGKLWALKVLDTGREEYKRLLQKDGTLDEIEILKALDHPLAPRMADMFTEEGDICIVMDLVKGESLQSVLDREGPQDPALVAAWMRDICGLLSYLHANGIIYRDLKPANIVLCEDKSVRLVDFGYPTKIVKNGVYSDSEAFGTPGYAAPEQIKRYSDERSDIYSAGATMRQLLTGKPPKAKGKPVPLKSYGAAISPGLREIVEKAQSAPPRDRFSSMDELCDALLNYKKAEKPYIERLRKKIAVSSALLWTGLSLVLSGLLIYEGFYLKDLHDYKSIVNAENASESELKAAAALLPAKTEACEALAELYSKDGLSASELSGLSAVYDSFEKAAFLKKNDHYDLNYRIACCILCYDNETGICDSAARLEKAAPFLKRASAGGNFKAQPAALLKISAALRSAGGEEAQDAGLADALLSLLRSQADLLGRDSSAILLSQDAAILNAMLLKRDAIAEQGSETFIFQALDLMERDISNLLEQNAGAESVLALLERVKKGGTGK